MKKPLLVISLLVAIIYACNHGDRTIHKLLRPGKLPAQTFTIDITKDTVLRTQNGALIRIPKGALKAGNNIVKLEVKEAYSMEDMVKGGLTTTSNGKPLRSGGMLYINPVGDNQVTITQAISIATPTSFLDSNMQVFKGEVQGDSTINWADPKPITENPQLNAIRQGGIMFYDNCASCHSVKKDLTGPALKGAMQRLLPVHNGDKKGIYDFIRNPVKVMSRVKYYQDLKQKFGGSVMTAFPALTAEDLDYIFAYIENESNRTYTFKPEDAGYSTCKDSCLAYFEAIEKWSAIKGNLASKPLVEENVRSVNDTPAENISPVSDITIEEDIPADTAWERAKTVLPSYNTSFYYQFTIDSFGWHNLDFYLANDSDMFKDSELSVKIPGEYNEHISIYLVLPSVKIFLPGGLLENKNDEYGFHEANGHIPLPQRATAYIIAMGEKDGEAIFGKKEFTTQPKQVIELPVKKLTKEALQRELATLRFNDFTIDARKTSNIEGIKNADKELENAKQLKPKNCDCETVSRPIPPEATDY